MAGKRTKTRRNLLPRLSSPAGRAVRQKRRAATMPVTTDKYRNGFTKPGSGNLRKIGRG